MADVLPQVTSVMVDILDELGEPELAAALPDQRFHGRCRCRPDCRFALTAPPGSSGTYMLWLESADETLGEADLDPDCSMVTAFNIDHVTLGLPPDWLDTADAAVLP
ncbi:hypothetical protein [Polymorphospora rubra]|nr:hypothetical protein [Polymorphospora rubra]